MKKIVVCVTSLLLAGAADATSTASFDAERYAACDDHSVGAVLVAHDAAVLKSSVQDVLNAIYSEPGALDVRLSLLASDAMKGGMATPADALILEHFLAGVCFGSGLSVEKATLKRSR